jgi:hypothetical protein
MVTKVTLLLTTLIALAGLACGSGGSTATPPTLAPRATNTSAGSPSGPQALVEPKSGPPGTQITVSGMGWPPGVQVDVTGILGTGITAPPYQTVTTDANGSFTARFRLEKTPEGKDLQVGRFDIIARSSTTEVDIPFLVEVRRPVGGSGPGG